MLFPGPDGDVTQDDSGLLSCRNAEVVIQTRISPDGAEDGDVYQLVIRCRYLDIVITFILFTNTYLQSDNSQPLMGMEAKPISH
jgi:hypothetical protein